jgi:hypothetical protein
MFLHQANTSRMQTAGFGEAGWLRKEESGRFFDIFFSVASILIQEMTVKS